MTGPEAVARYMEYLAASGHTGAHRNSPARSYLRRLQAFLVDRGVELLEVERGDLVAFMASQPEWAPETRRSCRSTMRGFYSWAEDEGLVPIDPARKLPVVRQPAGMPKPVPEGVLMAALASSDAETRLMLLLGAYAGLRRAEIARVHAHDVTDLGLRVTGKGNKTRVVPLHPLLVDELQGIDGWAFPSQGSSHAKPGQHVGVDYIDYRVTKALGKPWTCHTLRHRFASRAYAGTRDLRAVQGLLGHSNPETTARYTAMPQDAMTAAVAVL